MAEGRAHRDCESHLRYLNDIATSLFGDGQPQVSVDAKEKELTCTYANGEAEWASVGLPERVSVHDFADPARDDCAKAIL